jgi:hypothetical protein
MIGSVRFYFYFEDWSRYSSLLGLKGFCVFRLFMPSVKKGVSSSHHSTCVNIECRSNGIGVMDCGFMVVLCILQLK